MDVECSNCRFFFPFDGTLSETRSGMCRRYAPRPEMTMGVSERDASPGVVWPEVGDYDWCGEYAPKDPS